MCYHNLAVSAAAAFLKAGSLNFSWSYYDSDYNKSIFDSFDFVWSCKVFPLSWAFGFVYKVFYCCFNFCCFAFSVCFTICFWVLVTFDLILDFLKLRIFDVSLFIYNVPEMFLLRSEKSLFLSIGSSTDGELLDAARALRALQSMSISSIYSKKFDWSYPGVWPLSGLTRTSYISAGSIIGVLDLNPRCKFSTTFADSGAVYPGVPYSLYSVLAFCSLC